MAVDDAKKEIAAAGEHSAELQPGWFFYLLDRLDRVENNLRNEFKKDISEARQEAISLRSEFKQEIAGLRGELKQDIADVRNEVRSLRVQQFAVISGLVLTFAGVLYGLLTR